MKNKIIASVLAVALFVGMAVPAFADYSSGVDGDPSNVKTIEFAKGDKVVPEIVVKKDDTNGVNIADYVRLFESKDQLILNKENLAYELDGGSLVFGLAGSTVTAFDSKGSANVVVKNTLTGKTLGKIKVVASPAAPAVQDANSYKFKSNANTLIVGANAPAGQVISVVPVPTGSTFNGAQQAAIFAKVNTVLTSGVLNNTVITGNVKVNTVANAKAYLTGVPQDKKLVIEFKGDTTNTGVLAASPYYTVSAPVKSGSNNEMAKITVTVNTAKTNVDVNVASIRSAIKGVYPSAEITNYDTTVGAVKVLEVIKVAGVFGTSTDTWTFNGTEVGDVTGANAQSAIATTVPAFTPTFDAANKEVDFTLTNHGSLVAMAKRQSLRVIDGTFPTSRGGTTTVNSYATFQFDSPIDTKAIGGPGAITIEVGEERDLSKEIGYGPSNANISKTCVYTPDYMTDAEFSDYAAINDDGNGKIMGVRKGVNKVVVTSVAHPEQTTTVIVNVVSRGTKTTTPEVKPILGWTSSAVKVGGTTVLAVKNATGTITYSSSDDKIATVDKAGKITGVKAGTATISVKIGEETLKATVKVDAAKPDVKPTDPSKPTTNPSTGVALLGQLF